MFKLHQISYILVLTFFLTIHGVHCAGIPAPDDSEATVLPPSLVYQERPPTTKETPIGPIGSNVRDEVVETQHSTCQITTEELVASARATVTRVLKGLCNAREMDDRLHNLETQLADQMTVVKAILLNMEEKLSDIDTTLKKNSDGRQCNCEQTQQSNFHQYHDDNNPNQLMREQEISLYNSSIHFVPTPRDINNSTEQQRIFTYYWRVRDMNNKLNNWDQRRSIRSPSFYISPGSYKMFIRLYPRQEGKNVYVHVGLTKGDYDNQIKWPFTLKHRITILDQRMDNIQDIHSRVWDPTVLCSSFNWKKPNNNNDNQECVGLGFPKDVVRSRDYIAYNTLVIKLTVYLDL